MEGCIETSQKSPVGGCVSRFDERRLHMFFFVFVLYVVIGGALAVLTIDNLASPVVSFVVFSPRMTLLLPPGLLVLIAFSCGTLLLYFVSTLSAWCDWRAIKRLRRRVSELEQRITLQSAPPSAPFTPVARTPVPPRS
jgi:uncharacterized integral membrane protein